jgi:hypothetical protein
MNWTEFDQAIDEFDATGEFHAPAWMSENPPDPEHPAHRAPLPPPPPETHFQRLIAQDTGPGDNGNYRSSRFAEHRIHPKQFAK